MIGVALLAPAAAMTSLVVEARYDETTWPSDYRCKVLTDKLELIEFGMRLNESEATLDKGVAPFVANKPIALEWLLRSPKLGEKYARGMRELRGSENQFSVIQSGVPDHAITQVSFQAGKWDRPAPERGPLATGFCFAAPGKTKKVRTQ